MKNFVSLISGFAILLVTACSADDDKGISIFADTHDFNQDLYGWEVDFADYPVPKSAYDSSRYDLSSEYTTLPENLGKRHAIKISGTSADGKLFMYMRKKMSGFKPNTDYTLALEIELASSARVGSPEAENVYLKAGAFYMEPKKVIEKDTYTLNIDKGTVASAGEGMMVLGNIGTNATNGYSDLFSLITLSSNVVNTPYRIRSNSQGEIWLIVGTDAGFAGTTTIYYTKVSFIFSASN